VYNPFVLSAITTHVLDVSLGRPAVGVAVVLERGGQNQWTVVGHGATDTDGRARTLMAPDAALAPGVYRLVFDTRRYFEGRGVQTLYPSIVVIFEVSADQPKYHIPVLLSPFGYTTYRGS
jgi:5-hydroxyisourate hydrolase